ncbi:lycopene cyclase domain-containing protein [Homoserinimonas hongtaonis]|uniref:Lycopene cyclase n=1 Tax=Homoserinimonas hongtaonis TaxID=2079791 RepID=A0A2U1T1K9_9MICO|nr:lycopene cyclase domain-containing protein [Salinibacterium hongtaonis]PWB97730.1 lycopene cyclase [Salinibacterium hongtaonis]
MTYWALNAVFLAVVAVVALAAVLSRRAPEWRAVGLTALAVLLMTAVFDNVMIAADLFWYNPDRISGAFLGLTPLEDFAYAIAAVVLLPSLWHLIGGRNDVR